jgi:muramoyltetrapeptide carboxypeptidase
MTISKNLAKAGAARKKAMDLNSIYLFSPSGAVRDTVRFEKSISNLKANGFSVEIDRGALHTSQRFAGTDTQRLAAFNRAAKSSANIVMTTRGGYGITRLLPQLDYKTLAQSKKRWVGFSDFTAFQLAMLAKAKAITYSGPASMDVFGADEPDDLTVSMFGEGIRNELELVGFASKTPAHYKGFEAKGVLWGGNLSVLCSLQGSDYFPKVRGGLLMLEDVAEAPYKVERLLTQLLHSGVIDQQKAVLLGYFNQYKVTPHDDGFDMPTVVKWLRSKTKTPIVTGLPMGHAPLKFTLPHGAKIGLAIDGGTCYLLLH